MSRSGTLWKKCAFKREDPKSEAFMSHPWRWSEVTRKQETRAGDPTTGWDQRTGVHGNTQVKGKQGSPGLGSGELGNT